MLLLEFVQPTLNGVLCFGLHKQNSFHLLCSEVKAAEKQIFQNMTNYQESKTAHQKCHCWSQCSSEVLWTKAQTCRKLCLALLFHCVQDPASWCTGSVCPVPPGSSHACRPVFNQQYVCTRCYLRGWDSLCVSLDGEIVFSFFYYAGFSAKLVLLHQFCSHYWNYFLWNKLVPDWTVEHTWM